MNSASTGLWTVVLALHQLKLVARLTVGNPPLNLVSIKYVFISRLFSLKIISITISISNCSGILEQSVDWETSFYMQREDFILCVRWLCPARQGMQFGWRSACGSKVLRQLSKQFCRQQDGDCSDLPVAAVTLWWNWMQPLRNLGKGSLPFFT